MKNLYIATALLVLSSCSGESKEDVKETESRVDLVTTEVIAGEMRGKLVLNGDIACDERKLAKIFVPCTGKIQNIQVEIGDPVVKEQTLALLTFEMLYLTSVKLFTQGAAHGKNLF